MCLEANVLSTCAKLLGSDVQEIDQSYWDMLKRICLCIASVCEGRPEVECWRPFKTVSCLVGSVNGIEDSLARDAVGFADSS